MHRTISLLATLLAIGGVAWLVKVALIAANGGENTTEGIVAVFFFIGAFGLLVGSSSLGLWLARTRPVIVRVLAAILAITFFWLTFGLIDEAMQSIVGSAGPQWVQDEMGIVVTAIIWLAIGLWVRARARRAVVPVAAT